MITLRNISIVTGGSNWANWARTQHYSTLSQVLCALWVLSLSLSLSLSPCACENDSCRSQYY